MAGATRVPTDGWTSRLGSFDRRIHRRFNVDLGGLAFSTPRRQSEITIVDISASGCRLADLSAEFAPNQWITVSVNGMVLVEGIIRWSTGSSCGVEFLETLDSDVMQAVA